MADIETQIAQYKAEKVRLGAVEKALEIQKARVNTLVKAILEEHGKGPYDLGDGRENGHLILVRGETHFFSPNNRKAGT
jgi:uncharacterized protein YqfA (UPF0365 family)